MSQFVRAAFARYLDAAASVVTIIVLALVIWMAWANYAQDVIGPRGPSPSADENANRLTGQVVAIGNRVREGGHSSPRAVILEFSDFQCQYCRRYSRNLYPTVISELVESGKAAYAYRHYPIESLHNKALFSGQAAECAGDQGRFWDMHDILFKEVITDDQIARNAQNLHLDQGAFAACLKEGNADQRVKTDQAEARRLGIQGTPTFLIGTKLPGGQMKVLRLIEGAPALRALTEAVDEAIKATAG